MKKTILIFFALTFCAMSTIEAQKFFTRDGKVSFESDAPLEKIEAKNSNATSVLDTESGKLEFAVLVKAFQFEKALMQEHFNENYMESSKFPKAVFKGQIDNPSEVNFGKDGSYTANVTGQMNIHGVTQTISTTANIKVEGESILATSVFTIAVADYDIKIPKVVADNIAKEVKIMVDVNYKPFKR